MLLVAPLMVNVPALCVKEPTPVVVKLPETVSEVTAVEIPDPLMVRLKKLWVPEPLMVLVVPAKFTVDVTGVRVPLFTQLP